MYRHGDLIIKPIKVEKEKLKYIGKQTSFVLAEGETTGHKHTLEAEQGTAFNVYQNEQGQYILEMDNPAKLSHQEHNTIELLPDMYVVGTEREFSYADEQIKQVQD